MKKIAGILLLVAVTLAVAGYFSLGILVERGSRKGMELLVSEVDGHGVSVVGSGFRDARYSFPSTIIWRDVYGEMESGEDGPLPLGRNVSVNLGSLSLVPGTLGTPFSLSMEGIEVIFRDEGRDGDKSRQESGIRGDWAMAGLPLNLGGPEAMKGQLREIVGDVKSFLREGKTRIPVLFTGTATFPVQGKTYQARILIEREGEHSVLRMNGDDIIEISGEFNLKVPLTDAEVGLLSRYPLRAPRLLSIRSYARSESKEARNEDESVPEDAYRHLLWSYLLAKEFGEEFAEKVTDAHEEGLTGNTPAERRMDIANNVLGRKYFRLEVPEEKILQLAMSDPKVVRAP